MNIEKLLELAIGELGVNEDAGKDDDLAGRILAYRQAVLNRDPDRDPEPWCADFVSWCFREAGTPLGPNGEGFSYTPYLADWLDKSGFGFCVGEKFPQEGDIVVFDLDIVEEVRKGLEPKPDHVGIIYRVKENGDLVTIEGNYNNKVSMVERSDFGLIHVFGRLP